MQKDVHGWLVNALSVLTPGQALLVAIVGTIGLVVAVTAKRPRISVAGTTVFVFGGYGFASLLVGLLWLR